MRRRRQIKKPATYLPSASDITRPGMGEEEEQDNYYGGLSFSAFHRVCNAVVKVLPYELSYQNCTLSELDMKQRVYDALETVLAIELPNPHYPPATIRRAIRDKRALPFKPRNRSTRTHERANP